jgi:hypothetical protein
MATERRRDDMGHHSPASEQVPDAVTAWRRERLVAAGFDRDHARQLAEGGRYDLHALLELVDRGCPPHLAERIAAPLDDRRDDRPAA